MKNRIINDLKTLGIHPGDTVLMHSSFKSLGHIDGGAMTFFEAFTELLGEDGTLILPSLSYSSVTREAPEFDIEKTPVCVGYLPEFFRTNIPGVVRSLHATHSCCAKGKLAYEITKNHYLDNTPVGKHSPFSKLPLYGGKILMLGCGTVCNTSMHGVEETVEPPYCIDRDNPVTYILKDGKNITKQISYRHNFLTADGSHIKQRYDRITEFLSGNELSHGYVLEAECFLMDAKAVWEKGRQKLIEDPLCFVDYPD